MNLEKLFLLFIIYSFIGWIAEIIFGLFSEKKFVDRGFLIGPYCPIYGCGGLLITLTLSRYYYSPITLFVMSMFICALLEYITSYLLEKMFNTRWWDYTNFKFNINGRICLEMLAPFGILGCTMIYLVNPFLSQFLSLFSSLVIRILTIILALLFILDLIVSFKIISNFKTAALQFKSKDGTEEMTKKVKEVLINKSFWSKRLVDAFPNFRMVVVNIKKELDKAKKEVKEARKKLEKVTRKMNNVEKKINKYNKK